MPWFSITQAMEVLQISRRSVWRRIEDGSLPSKSEGGMRYVFIKSEDEEGESEVKTEDHKRIVDDDRGTLLTLALTENLFDLRQRIIEITKNEIDMDRLFSCFPNEDESGKPLDRWMKVLKIVNGVYEKIQKPGVGRDELRAFFSDLLQVRSQVESLEDKRVRDIQAEEFNDGEILENIEVSVKMIGREKDKLLDFFEQIFTDLRRLIASQEDR